jgi:PAP2 superfamily
MNGTAPPSVSGPTGVHNIELSWTQAAVLASGLIIASLGLRLARRSRLTGVAVFLQESSLVVGLFALWQFAGSFAVMGPGGALARGRWIWHLERTLHLPSETAVQRLFLPHPLLVQALNLYYDVLHFPVLIGCLIWLFIWHRDLYIRRRTTLALFTGACLLVQLIPVAPPRMLPGTGMVDTAVVYHQSVYQSTAGFDPDQLSAMPSVHVGWALLVAIMIISGARSRWRWLAVLYPAATTLAVVVTANHYWMDGIVAALILALVLALQAGLACLWTAIRLARVTLPGGRSRLRANVFHSLLLSYRPTWDHRGTNDPIHAGGTNGRSGAIPERDRAPARCDRAP